MMIASIAELDRIRAECRRLVTSRAMLSAGAAVVPIPGADIIADIGLLTKLLPTISGKFGLDHDRVKQLEPHVSKGILVAASSLGNTAIGRKVTKAVVLALVRRMGVRMAAGSSAKYVPVIGSAITVTISFGAMRLLGNAHVEDCYRIARQMLDRRDTGPG